MKDIIYELYLENRHFKKIFFARLALFLAFLLSGALLQGFPYIICFYLAAMSLEFLASMLYVCNAERLVPRTPEELRRTVVGKALIKTIVYTGSLELGYLLTVTLCGGRRLDRVSVFLLAEIGLLSFFATFASFLQSAYALRKIPAGTGHSKTSAASGAAMTIPYVGFLYLTFAIILHWGRVITLPPEYEPKILLAEGALGAILCILCLIPSVRIIQNIQSEN